MRITGWYFVNEKENHVCPVPHTVKSIRFKIELKNITVDKVKGNKRFTNCLSNLYR